MEEQWKSIKGYDGLYEISNKGNIRSLDKYVRRGNGFYFMKGKLLKPQLNSKGYKRIGLKNNGKTEKFFIHRLVAEAFIPHSTKCNVVNHKDFNILNNTVDNLEWTTQDENIAYSAKRGRFAKHKEWKNKIIAANEKYTKAVIGVNILTGKEIKFKHLNDVKTKGFQPSCVCCCCKGKRETHAGYYWKYV